MNSLIALINALTAPVSLSALKSVLLAMVGQQQEFTFDVTIPSADVLDLFDTPIELVPAQGANKIIVPITLQAELIYNTTPYATNGSLLFKIGSESFVAITDTSFLFQSTSRFTSINSNSIVGDTSDLENENLNIEVQTGNPTAGDSDIRIYGTYKVIDIS